MDVHIYNIHTEILARLQHFIVKFSSTLLLFSSIHSSIEYKVYMYVNRHEYTTSSKNHSGTITSTYIYNCLDVCDTCADSHSLGDKKRQ